MKYYLIKNDYCNGIDYGITIEEYNNFEIAYYHYLHDFHVIKMIIGNEFNGYKP